MQKTESALPALMRLVAGYQVSQAIHVAAVLGIADLLRGGAKTSDELATQTQTDGEALYRLLRALAAEGVFEEGDGRHFSLTALGECLRSDSAVSALGWARLMGEEYFWNAWGSLLAGVKAGENVFRHLHGEDVWSYRAKHPEASLVFDGAMTSLSRMVSRQVLSAYDFSPFSLVVDVGGGRGSFLADILSTHQSLRGVLFDQAHVASDELLKSAGMGDRSRVVHGSFFESVPEGGDAYVLKSIIHDWPDGESIAILKNCRRAVAPAGKLLLVERVIGAPNEGPRTKFSDLNMFVMPGGRERTEDEFRQLYDASGFRLTRVVSSGPDQTSVVEGVPV